MSSVKFHKVKGVGLATLVLIMGQALYQSQAGRLEPDAPPGPTMKTLDQVEPRIPIPGSHVPALPYVIDKPGSYYLTGNRYCKSHGIIVNADQVTIDLMGYSLIGDPCVPDGCGIGINKKRDIEIRHGTICHFEKYGIGEPGISFPGRKTVENVQCHNNGYGIFLLGSYNTIRGSLFCLNKTGGLMLGAYSMITENKIRDNGECGISAHYNNIIINNIIYSNTLHGIEVTDNCTIKNNIIAQNEGCGIYADKHNVITNNSFYFNDENGISAKDGSNILGNTMYWQWKLGIMAGEKSLVKDNNIEHCRSDGINVGKGSMVMHNVVSGNVDDGIETQDGCTVRDNILTANEDYGIYARNGCTVIGNTASEHTNDYGIRAGTGATLKDNTAYNNLRGIYTAEGSTVIGNSASQNQTWGIYVKGDSLVDQNTAFGNNIAGGGANLYAPASCTVIKNHAP